MIPKYREFNLELDSVVYKSIKDLAKHLEINLSTAFLGEIAKFCYEVEVAQEKKLQEAVRCHFEDQSRPSVILLR